MGIRITLLSKLYRVYCFFLRPNCLGCRILIQNGQQFLLIRHSYGNQNKWNIPGGGLKTNETLEDAAVREVQEEVGIVIQPKNLLYLGQFESDLEFKHDTVKIFLAMVKSTYFAIDNDEIKEARWVSLNKLPELQSLSLKNALKYYKIYAQKLAKTTK